MLHQPWYFWPSDIALDMHGRVFLVDAGTQTVQKLNAEGQFVTKWKTGVPAHDDWWIPHGIAVGPSGNVYVTDSGNHCIQKFTSSGQYISHWGSQGTGNGQFDFRIHESYEGGGGKLTIDGDGYVYVADTMNHRIQKFTIDGEFIKSWGALGTGNGEFDHPGAITINENGSIYVVDTFNHRVQKFTSEGEFITKWGSFGSGDNQFDFVSGYPDGFGPGVGITVDGNGHVYVADSSNMRIQKFDSDGNWLLTYGEWGVGDGNLMNPTGVAVDQYGYIYVADGNFRVSKFTSDFQFVTKWGSTGANDGEFNRPNGIAVDTNGFVYVSEPDNVRIQKFTANGQFIKSWDIDYWVPGGVAVDNNGNVYVVDVWEDLPGIKKFDTDGNPLDSWGGAGTGNGQFNFPCCGAHIGIAVNSSGQLYVADPGNHRIQRFDLDGNYQTQWGSYGSGTGQFNFDDFFSAGLAIGPDGSVYVADHGNHRIQKFDANGGFLTTWGTGTWEEGDIRYPRGVAVDADGNIHVADNTSFLKIYSPTGAYIDRYAESGSAPGQQLSPYTMVAGPSGTMYADKIFIADTMNNRIQVLKKLTPGSIAKAVVVAGGGPYPGNNLWDATQMNANFAYRTLTSKGFTKQNICYLTSDLDLDLDGNGVRDDVAGDATNANLQQAITAWAADAEELTLYLIDHGGSGTFRMSGTENLTAAVLDSWLDQLQATLPGKVTVIYDACESGSFVSALTPPAGKERIVITSTSPDESAYFVSQGSVSFSNFFWTNVFNGSTVKSAFDLSTETVAQTTGLQHPLLDDDADGVGNGVGDGQLAQATYIGNGIQVAGDAPVIGSVSGDQEINDQNWADLFANDVTDGDGIARVWAVIKPPDYVQGAAGNPVQELPGIDLMPVDGQPGRYEATYTNFSIPGTYYIAIYARDRLGNTAVPLQTTVAVNNPLRHKAIVIAGKSSAQISATAVSNIAQLAYRSLQFQGYADDDIYLLSQAAIGDLPVDGPATLAELQAVMATWALDKTQDLVVYLVGAGGFQQFQINTGEALTAQTLDQQLDAIQATIPGRVTVVYDGSESGSFVPVQAPPAGKERVVLTSTATGQQAYFLVDGAVSFSTYFWIRILNGTPLYEAFTHAHQSTAPFASQVPQFDANGNGVGNEKADWIAARYYTLGSGIMLAGDDPLIGAVSPDQTVNGSTTADIWAEDIATTGNIDRVWAVVSSPTHVATALLSPQVVDLLDGDGDGRYTGSVGNLALYGIHTVAVYAMDTNGNVSLPAVTHIEQTVGPDIFEEDDTHTHAGVIIVNGSESRTHTFHDQGDVDWVQFYAVANEWYDIKTENLGTNCDTVVILYDADLNQLTNPDDLVGDAGGYQFEESISWQCPADGIYYVKVMQYHPEDFGADTQYDLKVYIPAANTPGMLTGQVADMTGLGIGGALVQTDLAGNYFAALSLPNGRFLMPLPAGTFTVKAELAGHAPQSQTDITVTAAGTHILNWTFDLGYPGDVNEDGYVDLIDAVTILRVLCGFNTGGQIRDDYSSSRADANRDGMVGVEDIVFILQEVSGMR